jgi:hypothetical protein
MLDSSALAPTIGMRRSTVRIFAFFVLALLGAPVAMHVVMHDLHAHQAEHADAVASAGNHSDHEHPIVSSTSPQVPGLSRAVQPVIATALPERQRWTRFASNARNVIAHGAIHSTDDDVGLHSLFSTFLI